eukprot:CAMPEP_0204304406 /NCGR_PEP_ID=MMETSP0468-20130131/84395_1 /ASSEMBLY_ACC=CAM_ASM_000383 /TAXON_ID=2969 /ORGANISM="Oxyrrhis marina" /LENGTH=91 /DNA_ID=CAMNT_0051283729 /DNA_START=1402 /DNA_END=1677 /DNA_ORIENTATION=-
MKRLEAKAFIGGVQPSRTKPLDAVAKGCNPFVRYGRRALKGFVSKGKSHAVLSFLAALSMRFHFQEFQRKESHAVAREWSSLSASRLQDFQ